MINFKFPAKPRLSKSREIVKVDVSTMMIVWSHENAEKNPFFHILIIASREGDYY